MLALAALLAQNLKKVGFQVTDISSLALSSSHLGSNSGHKLAGDQDPNAIAIFEIWRPIKTPFPSAVAPIDSSWYLMQTAEAAKCLPSLY